MQKIVLGAFALMVLTLVTRASSQPVSYWNHNGSVVYLVTNGNIREFYYYRPRAGMREEGVEEGTLLFTGTVSGDTYDGTAYIFSARCGKRGYHVAGTIARDGARVVLSGAVMLLGGNCQPTRLKNDLLVFDYLYQGYEDE